MSASSQLNVLSDQGFDGQASLCRITSYNVCYTKLLRSNGWIDDYAGQNQFPWLRPSVKINRGDKLLPGKPVSEAGLAVKSLIRQEV